LHKNTALEGVPEEIEIASGTVFPGFEPHAKTKIAQAIRALM
jgi:hypothetical protein